MENACGRANQMNAGAAQASGRIVLFLHADTLPPDDYARTIRKTLDHEEIISYVSFFSTEISCSIII